MPQFHIAWAGRGDTPGLEVSTRGDSFGKQFSAFNAFMPDGRTIEQWYQCDIKGYDQGGRDWRKGKGKPPRFAYPGNQLWELYLGLWRLWAIRHSHLLFELRQQASSYDNILKDSFADPGTNSINQARALAQIINEWII